VGLNGDRITAAAVQVLFVAVCVSAALGPLLAIQGGGGGDESGEHFGIFFLYFPLLGNSIHRRIGLKVAADRQFPFGRVLRLADQYQFARQILVVVDQSLLLRETQWAKRPMLDAVVGLAGVELRLGGDDIDEVALLGVGLFQDAQPLLPAAKVPYVRVHYRINHYHLQTNIP